MWQFIFMEQFFLSSVTVWSVGLILGVVLHEAPKILDKIFSFHLWHILGRMTPPIPPVVKVEHGVDNVEKIKTLLTFSCCGNSPLSSSKMLHGSRVVELMFPAWCVILFRLQIYQDLRDELAKVKTLEALADVSKQLKQHCQVETLKTSL